MTDFDFIAYADWISKNCHYDQCGIAPNNDSNINHVTLLGEKLEHPRVFRTLNISTKLLNDIEEGGIETPYEDNVATNTRVRVIHTERFVIDEEIFIEDNNGSEIKTIADIVKNQYLTVSGLANAYDIDELYTVSSIREFELENPENGDYKNGDFVRLGTDDQFIIRQIIQAPVKTSDKTTIKCTRIVKGFSQDDLVSVIYPADGIAPDIDDKIIIPERTHPFNPQMFGVKAGSLHQSTLKDFNDDDIIKNSITIESDAALEYGSINLLFTTGDEDYSRYAQNLNFNNPVILPGLNTDEFDYASDADMQLIWKGTTTTIDTDTLKWTYSSNSIYALFPLPLDFKTRSSGDNEFSFKIKGTGGNTGTLNIILHGADGSTFTTLYTGDLTNTSFTTFMIDLDDSDNPFKAKQFVKKIEFEITGGSGILFLDDVTPFKVPNFDDLMGNPTGVVGSKVGAMAVYYDVREAPIHPLTANASASELATIQLTIADSSDFTDGDTIVLYDLDSFEFATIVVDDGTHITATPVYGTFYYDYTTAAFASVQLLTYKVRNIAGSYTENTELEEWIKADVSGDFLLIKPDVGEWDKDSVSEPSAFFENGDLYISYTGRDGAVYGIGFALSTDFLTFLKLPNNPFIASHDNSKIAEYSDFEGIIARDGNNDIKVFRQKSGFLNHPNFHVTMLVKPDATLGDSPNEGMVLYDQGNFRIVVNHDYSLTLHARFAGRTQEISTKSDDNITVQNNFGTHLVQDHWNLIVAQTQGTEFTISRVGLMSDWIINEDYFKLGPWKFDSNVSANDTSVDITLDRGSPGTIPEEDQAILMRGFGSETDWTDKIRWQLNRITSVVPYTGGYTCNLLNPIGPWGFIQTGPGGEVYGPTLAQGRNADLYAYPESSTGEFTNTVVNEKTLPGSLSSDKTEYLSTAHFQAPKVGSDVNGKRVFTKGIIAHVDCATDILDTHTNWTTGSRLDLFALMIESYTSFGDRPLPQWWREDLTADLPDYPGGTQPAIFNSVAYWDFTLWDGTKVPDIVHGIDLYNNGANFVVDLGYGYIVEFDKNENLRVFKYSNSANIVEVATLIEAITGPSPVETPVNAIPQLFDEGIAIISTLQGAKGYFTTGTIILDIFESTELPSSLDVDGFVFNPPNCSVKLYISFKKATDFPDVEVAHFNTPGHETINETIDMSGFDPLDEELIYRVRLKLEFISDGNDTSELSEIQASATGIVSFPSADFLDTWIDTNSNPCLEVKVFDDDDDELDDQTPNLLSVTNVNYDIPIFLDDQSDILPSGVTFTFANFDGFWNPNNALSPLNGKNYLDFKIQIFAGFGTEFISQGIYKIENIRQGLRGSVEIPCTSEFREVLDERIGQETPESFIGIWKARDLIEEWLKTFGGIPAENIFFEDGLSDYDVRGPAIDNQTIISLVRSLAAAANYVVYINNQGDIRVINRVGWDEVGTNYSNSMVDFPLFTEFGAGKIIEDANLTSAMRKNLIKKVKVTGANGVSVVVENVGITFGRHYDNPFNNFIENTDEATTLANQLIADYGLDKQILDADLKYSPHLRLLDILTFLNPISGIEDSYLITSINRNLTGTSEKITAILI